MINPKTMSRLACVQALYNYEMQEDADVKAIEDLMIEIYKEKKILDPSLYSETMSEEESEELENLQLDINEKYFLKLFRSAIESLYIVDQIISKNLKASYKISNLHLTLLSILRAGINELKNFHSEVPFNVIISEYTNIAANMLGNIKEVNFVNSILQTFREQIKLENNELESNK